MGTYNTLQTNMTCPHCRQAVHVTVDLYFGDTRAMDEYAIGDRCRWIPRKAIHNGGRPEGGNLDGKGYAECPRCQRDFFVKVLVRDDVIAGIEPDTDKPAYVPPPAAAQEKPVARGTQPGGVSGQKESTTLGPTTGLENITFNPNWQLTKKRKTALLRLAELGVSVGPTVGSDGFRLIVPFNLHPDVYVEVGYLMAQLGDEDFPDSFHHPIAVSYAGTALFDCQPGAPSPVRAGDSVVQGYRYYVTPRKELEG